MLEIRSLYKSALGYIPPLQLSTRIYTFHSFKFIMRLNIPPDLIRLGDVALHKTFRVTELDAGHSDTKQQRETVPKSKSESEDTSIAFSQSALHGIEKELAIIVPCMNEPLHLLEGVLRGIPNPCSIILVSNSKNDTPDSNFTKERDLLTNICTENKRAGIIVHQADEGLAKAFKAAGMPTLVQQVNPHRLDGTKPVVTRVRKGKGEAMMIGVALAKLAGKHCVGFIDADNWVPGAVHEYCKVYAAGLQYAIQSAIKKQSADVPASNQNRPEMHAMVRVRWNSKPKVEDHQLVHKDSGRCSRIVNFWMNRFLDTLAPENTHQDLVQTANAGEHAMNIELAMRLHFATGYAVEPYQLVDIIEQFGAQTSSSANNVCGTARKAHFERSTQTPVSSSIPQVRIIQVRTCNPHIHDFSKGEQHIENMQVQGLGAIYHSALASCKLKKELRSFMKDYLPAGVDKSGVPERPIVYPSLDTLDLRVLRDVLKAHSSTLEAFGSV